MTVKIYLKTYIKMNIYLFILKSTNY